MAWWRMQVWRTRRVRSVRFRDDDLPHRSAIPRDSSAGGLFALGLVVRALECVGAGGVRRMATHHRPVALELLFQARVEHAAAVLRFVSFALIQALVVIARVGHRLLRA